MQCPTSVLAPNDVLAAKTMLSREELSLLYELARDHYVGLGEIVDGGAFLGGSTLALAAGLGDNPRNLDKRARVHSYDLFRADQFTRRYLPDMPDGATTRPYYESVLSARLPHVQVCEGDICTFPWPHDRQIEVLFIDVAKTWEINDFLVHQFFPRLIPGHSIVIHQDYHWPDLPWIPITMELLADHFTYVGSIPWASAVYRCVRAIDATALPQRLRDLPAARLHALLARAQRWERGQWNWTIHQCNEVSLCIALGELDRGATLLREVIEVTPEAVARLHYRPAALTSFMPQRGVVQ